MKMFEFLMFNNEYLEDFATRFTYNSNAIEGSTLTFAETYAILYNDNSFKIERKEPREIYEAINHKNALEILFNVLKEEDMGLTERFIKNINEEINKNINDTKSYRKVQVYIKGSEHIPPRPEQIPNLMNYFVYNYNNDKNDIYIKVANYHIQFESIHPFEDGNGRTGRLLINYELLKNDLPPIVISKDDRVKYFEFIRSKDIQGMANWLKELSEIERNRF